MTRYLPPLILQDDVGVADIVRLVETIKVESIDPVLVGGEDVGITIILNIIITLLSIVHTTYISQLLQLVHILIYY